MRVATPQERQADLDALAVRMRWQRNHYRTWLVRGYTVGMSAQGYPRKYMASKNGRRREFGSLDDLVEFVLGGDPAAAVGRSGGGFRSRGRPTPPKPPC